MINSRCCIAVFIIVVMIGCVSLGERKQINMLEQRTEHYETALRWGKYEIARAFIKIKGTTYISDNLDALKQIKITSYTLLDRHVLENNEKAEQTVEIKYYNIDNLIEKTIIDNQRWVFDRELGDWFLLSGLPDFK